MEQNRQQGPSHSVFFVSRRLWIVTLSIFLTASAVAAGPSEKSLSIIDTQHIEVGVSEDHRNPLVKIDIQIQEMDSSEQSLQSLAKLISLQTQTQKATVLLSTDNKHLLQNTLQQMDLVPQQLHLVALPELQSEDLSLPHLESQKHSKFLSLIQNYPKSAVNSVKNDRIGFLILTYTTAAESLIWIHSSNLSSFERTSSVVYTVALALVFGLNKDSWAIATRPIQQFFRNILKSDINNSASFKEFATRFLGNVILGAVVTGLRIPLISIDQIIQSGIQLHYFSMPLLMTIVSTAAVFTWSENLAMIDEKVRPISKFIFRRVNEMRSIILATFATSAALLNPVQYGSGPWLVMGAVGTTGALIYFNAASIHQWIETQPWLQKLKSDSSKNRTEIGHLQFQCSMFFN